MFKQNVGGFDRVARLAIGTLLLPIGLVLLIGGVGIVGIAAAAAGVIGLVTAATGFCPSYVLLGWSTARDRTAALGGAR
jgi:Protein of unknown function (DUF2892)